VPAGPASVLNVMSVDVEEHFQVSAFERSVDRRDWPRYESRVCANTERLLELFARFEVRATFFTLGWVAERFPGLVRAIVAQGHELASHGYAHRLAYDQDHATFRDDLRRARAALECAGGVRVLGYRAPSYSVIERSLWALDVLVEEGYEYDASIYPIRHDRYGIPGWRRHFHRVQRPSGSIWELPGSTVRVLGNNLPMGGGGYFRLLPYGWTRQGIRRVNEVERQPAIFYLHPWEIDPEQPRLPGSLVSRFRHYRNLDKTYGRLEKLLTQFRFATVQEVLSGLSARAGGADGVMGVPLAGSGIHEGVFYR
jgi:polysaccharide deacetylase family protein (PEP-CTERM system associated)